MDIEVAFQQEDDGRLISEVVDLPGMLAYGATQVESQSKVIAIVSRVVVAK